jgi:type II secretory pathway pseudopilin PulG
MIRDRVVPLPTVPKRRCSDDHGFALVEAIVAAAIFALIVLGVLAGIDGAAGSSGREKARSIAGTLAEQDQERMRGMRAVDLSNYSWDRNVTVGGATYRIQSDSDWIRDNTGGTISCQNSAIQADYLRIRTSVTSSSVGKRTAPVKIDSLMAPPIGAVGTNQGTLAVQINNRDGIGVAGIVVKITNLAGTLTLTETTNAVGCAVFAYIPIGGYDVNVKQAGGWVNPEGVNDVHVSGNVSNGTTNATTIVYDVAGTVTMNMRTKAWDAEANAIVDIPSRAYSYGLANAGVTSTGYRQFFPATAPATTVTATQLFPFKDAYGLYSGRCLTPENPGTANGGGVQIVDRAGIYTNDVYQPALRVKVVNGANAVTGATVVATIRPGATGCGTPIAPNGDKITGLTTFSGVATDKRNGFVTQPAVPGIPFDPGIPYGTWDICVQSGTQKKTLSSYSNRTLAGNSTVTTLDMSTGTTTGTCT